MCSQSYGEFPNHGGFIIPEAQRILFIALQEYKPEIYEELIKNIEIKSQNFNRQTLVTIYGDYNDSNCPKKLLSMEEFGIFSKFTINANVAPEIHNPQWITESISVVGHMH